MANDRSEWFSIQHESHGYSPGMTTLLFLYSLVVWSPLTVAIGIRWSNLLIMIALFTLAISVVRRRSVKLWVFGVSFFYLLTLMIPAVYWMDARFLLFPMPFLVALFMLSQATLKEIDRLVDWGTWLMLLMLVLAALAFLLVLGGMPPLYEFPRPDVSDASLYFFGTTFTNFFRPPIIRPAGIYDEPGALSFAVCAIAFMRHALGKDYKLTWVLLTLGFVTLSLAHFIFVAVFFMAERLSVRKIGFAFVVVAAVSMSLLLPAIRATFADYLLVRVVNSSTGDNRLDDFLNAWDILRSADHVAYVGVDPACSFDSAACDAMYPPRGENPLQHLAERGIFASWPYYLFLVIALVLAVRSRRNLPFFGFALLFLQRPYLLSFGYALLGVLACWLQIFAYPRRLPGGTPRLAGASSVGASNTGSGVVAT